MDDLRHTLNECMTRSSIRYVTLLRNAVDTTLNKQTVHNNSFETKISNQAVVFNIRLQIPIIIFYFSSFNLKIAKILRFFLDISEIIPLLSD